MEYKTTAKLVIQACDKDLPGVFGHGCVLLLQGIAREHSLNRAAKSMGMAYSKAWRIVNEAEGQLGCKLIERDGARGSTLTPAGERAIEVYETLQDEINEAWLNMTDAMFYLSFMAVLTLVSNLLTDIMYAVVDPRVRIS